MESILIPGEISLLLVGVATILVFIFLNNKWTGTWKSRSRSTPTTTTNNNIKNNHDNGIRYPPGPFNFPFLGSIFLFPVAMSKTRRHQGHLDLARKYGEIYSYKIGSINVIMLNTVELIKEAFIGKGESLSDRTSPGTRSFLEVSGEFSKYSGMGIGEANYGKIHVRVYL